MNDAKMKKELRRIIAGAVLYGCALASGKAIFAFWLFAAAYLVLGYDVLWNAVRNIFRGRLLDENFLMGVASLGAMIISEYSEGVAVMLFYQIGELFQSYAVGKSRRSIAALMDIRPDYANLRLADGSLKKADPYDVQIGDTIVVKPGEKVPLDAVVLEGSSMLDTSALTGESVPRSVGVGDELLSGCINSGGLLTARVAKEFGESTISKILDLVENASSKKSASENFITRFARWYTPAVVITALLLAVLPPLLLPGAVFSDWAYRALVFLVISCPCALVISVPLSFFGGIGGASKCGILVKGSNYLETLSKTRTAVFDKTGTLTRGVFRVQRISPRGVSEEELLEKAALAESFSTHPIALSLREAYGCEPDTSRVHDVRELAGLGLTAEVDGTAVAVGNGKLMAALGLEYQPAEEAGTVVYIAIGGSYSGNILIADEVKPDSAEAIALLKAAGIGRTVMLTGDAKAIGESVAAQLGIDEVYTELLPADKVEKVEELLANKPAKSALAFVGDGINDAPVLARADLGIAMGGLGSDAAIEAADIVIMTDEPSKIAKAVRISRKTLRIVRENIIFALGVKVLVLALGAAGEATMWEAVFADVGVSVIAILNSIRMLRVKNI